MGHCGKIYYLQLTVLFFAMTAGSCNREVIISDNNTQVLKIRTVEAGIEKCAHVIESYGTVIYESKADIYPSAESIITDIMIKTGDYVEKGRVLAILDHEKLDIRKMQIEANVESGRSMVLLAGIRLEEGKKEAEKTLISISSAKNNTDQKEAELAYIERLYNNKKELYLIDGISSEDLESFRIRYMSAENDFIMARNDLLIRQTGFTDKDIILAGYRIPESVEEKIEIFKIINSKLPAAELASSKAELLSLEAELKNINMLIDESVIRTPVEGITADCYFDIGEKVTPQNKLFTIFKIKNVFIRVNISSSEINKIKKGQEADILSGQQILQGKVEIIKPFINPETGSCEIKIITDNSSNLLLPGSFSKVIIKTGEESEKVFIPADAVLIEEDKHFIFVVRQNRLFKKEIIPDFKKNNRFYLISGLDYGEIVCNNPLPGLRDGIGVEIIK